MTSVNLPCMKLRNRCCPLLKDDAALFCSSLIQGLGKLEESLEGSLSVEWCVDAMNVLKKMQSELLALFKKSSLPISYGSEEDWFDQYMQETATLLDFCNTLKSAVSRFSRYCMVLDFETQMIVHDGILTINVDIDKLELKNSGRFRQKFLDVEVLKETERLGSKISVSSKREDKGMVVVMLVAKITMIVVSLLLVSALVSPVSIDIGGSQLSCKIPELKPWCESLSAISCRFHAQFTRPAGEVTGLAVVEHEKVAEVVRDLNGKLESGKREEEFLRCLENLKEKSSELKERIEKFDTVLDEVFDEVIKGRNEVLGIFRDETLKPG